VKKSELLAKWRTLKPSKNLLAVMKPLPEKHEGKTFGLDGIRIDGSEEFIFEVMSRLTDLIDGENNITRLHLSIADCEKAEAPFNKGNGGHVCYIRLAMRTLEGAHVSAVFDRNLHATTEKYAQILGA